MGKVLDKLDKFFLSDRVLTYMFAAVIPGGLVSGLVCGPFLVWKDHDLFAGWLIFILSLCSTTWYFIFLILAERKNNKDKAKF